MRLAPNCGVLIDWDVFDGSEPGDGLYEQRITCASCGIRIGDWHDEHGGTFTPYWMMDEDNNCNVCVRCHDGEVTA